MDKKRKRPERGWCLIHSFTHLSIHPPIHPLTQQTFNEDLLRAGRPLWLHCLQCGRPGFHPWVGKILWRRERLPTPVFWPREVYGLYMGRKELDTTERLSLHFTSLGYKTILHKCKKIEILSSIFSNHNGMRLGKKVPPKK